jgi:methionyl-tRNA synthetase
MARILITSAIPYINGIKHLGNLVGSQLPADLHARYMRARGHEVLFSAPPTNTARQRNWPPPRRASPSPITAPGCTPCRKELADGFRLSFDISAGRPARRTMP